MAGPVRDILLDSDGNRLLVNGDYGRADGLQAVKQGIEGNVALYLGEVWLDESLGVPYFELILIRNPNPLVIKAEVGKAIAATPDVTDVVAVSYSVDPVTRKGTVAYTCNSTAGTVSGTVTP